MTWALDCVYDWVALSLSPMKLETGLSCMQGGEAAASIDASRGHDKEVPRESAGRNLGLHSEQSRIHAWLTKIPVSYFQYRIINAIKIIFIS